MTKKVVLEMFPIETNGNENILEWMHSSARRSLWLINNVGILKSQANIFIFDKNSWIIVPFKASILYTELFKKQANTGSLLFSLQHRKNKCKLWKQEWN